MNQRDTSRPMRQIPCRWAYAAVLLFGLSLLLWIIPNQVPSRSFGEVLTPQTFPYLIAAIITACALILFLASFWRPAGQEQEVAEFPRHIFREIGWIILALLAYVLAIGWVGYYLSTFIALLVFMWLVGVRAWKLMLTVTATVSVLIYIGMGLGLRVRFPDGLFW
ncbi:MAG: tripartite tricarboxylate transporter TctB family protein [Aquisalimonadaceae bacterium]